LPEIATCLLSVTANVATVLFLASLMTISFAPLVPALIFVEKVRAIEACTVLAVCPCPAKVSAVFVTVGGVGLVARVWPALEIATITDLLEPEEFGDFWGVA